MALTVKGYMSAMRQRQLVIARALGVDLATTDKTTRVVAKSHLALLAVLVKTLTDKGVISDAELIAVLNEARDDAWPDEPTDLPPVD